MFRHIRVILRSLRMVPVVLNCNKICLFLYIKNNIIKTLKHRNLQQDTYVHCLFSSDLLAKTYVLVAAV